MGKKFSVYATARVAAVMVCITNSASGQVTFEWATVGNVGNAADPLNSGTIPGIGSVGNEYRIAKHEVTNEQYAVFLNAVAATDTNNLYTALMGSNSRGGITRAGSSGGFTYAVKADMGNKPVNFVSLFDAMRFVNWLHAGQPTGAQDASTTEDGVYTISDGLSEIRAVDARFFIPTENEWYKAAYHQPVSQGGDAEDYWLYPTATNSVPTMATAAATGDISNPGANVANFGGGAVWNDQDGNVTTVGSAGASSESFYGTANQGGNVWERNEALVEGVLRGLRGGSWLGASSNMRSSFQAGFIVGSKDFTVGFRVASPVPQTPIPAVSEWALLTMVLLILAAATIVLEKKIPRPTMQSKDRSATMQMGVRRTKKLTF